MQQILTKINTQKRMVDTSAKVLDLQERLTNKHGAVPALISPARRFLRHGPVTEIDLATKKIVCFFFFPFSYCCKFLLFLTTECLH